MRTWVCGVAAAFIGLSHESGFMCSTSRVLLQPQRIPLCKQFVPANLASHCKLAQCVRVLVVKDDIEQRGWHLRVSTNDLSKRELVPFSARRVTFGILLQMLIFLLAGAAGKHWGFLGPAALGSGFCMSWSVLWIGLRDTAPLLGLGLTVAILPRALPPSSMLRSALRRLYEVSSTMVLVMFGSRWRPAVSICVAAAVGVAAGLSEELVFRGLLQTSLVEGGWFSPLPQRWAVVVQAFLFGLCHAVTPLYFVLATLCGAYFGYLFVISGNLAIPIISHAAYDFAALVLMHFWLSTKSSRISKSP